MPIVAPNATSVRAHLLLRDSTTGLAKIGVLHTGVKMYLHETFTAVRMETPTNVNTANTDPFSERAWKEVDSTNMAGLYTYDVTDATWATTAGKQIILQPSAIAAPAPFFTAPIIYYVQNPGITTADYNAVRDVFWQATLGSYGAGTAGKVVNDITSPLASLGTRLPAALSGGRMDCDVQALDGSTLAASYLSLALLGGTLLTVDTGTFPSTTTQFETSTAGLSSTDDFYNGKLAYGIVGNLAQQVSEVTDYTGASGRFAVAGFTNAPSHGSIIFLS